MSDDSYRDHRSNAPRHGRRRATRRDDAPRHSGHVGPARASHRPTGREEPRPSSQSHAPRTSHARHAAAPRANAPRANAPRTSVPRANAPRANAPRTAAPRARQRTAPTQASSSYNKHISGGRSQRTHAALGAGPRRTIDSRIGILAVAVAAILVIVFVIAPIFGRPADAPATTSDSKAPAVHDAAAASKPAEINLMMIGDILQHSGVFQSGERSDGTYNFDHIFANIAGELDGQDVKVLNQETILGGTIGEYIGYPSFNGPQEMGDAEAAVGFNVILRASNHTMDMGYAGIHSELTFWKTKHPDVHVLGAIDVQDSNHGSLDDVYVYEKDGFKVALLNYTYGLNGYIDDEGAVSMLEDEHIKKTMAKAKESADMIVVFPHWGEEYHTQPVDSQIEWEKKFVELGADVIIGDHPHVIEPVETIDLANGKKGVCFWSIGNFVSTQPDDENLVGGLAKVTLKKDADGSCSVARYSFEPTVTHKGVGSNMTTYMLRDYTDALAATNEISYGSSTTCTPEWVQSFVADVLGSGYDPASCKLSVDLTKSA